MGVRFQDRAIDTVNFRRAQPLPRIQICAVREHEDDAEGCDDNLYEYDAERCFFKRRQPLGPTIKPEPVTRRRRFFGRLPDGTCAMTYSLDDIYEYDAKKKRFVRVAK